ncbi:MAG: glycosyl hydrolase family 18 protein [Lachnospiraceae bacterium]|nr:glycosyl hydrolase family 18 protein [Lachnospiraceae bacterium]
MELYTVKPGDNIDAIAAAFQIPVDSIIYVNQLIPPYALAVGQALLLDTPSLPAEKPSLVSFGYAYTYISPWVLRQTLPFLTELYIFSYGFTMEGNLISPPLDDVWMINEARNAGVRSVLTLTPFGPDGRFNNALIHSVVQNPAYKQNLIEQLLEIIEEKSYSGVDVDFEYILALDRDAFTAFVSDLANALRPLGCTTSVALAPKTSAGQTGLLYEGKDYRGLGQAADSVLLMTYEWGYKYGPNMAVAPINLVRRVVEYAVTEIPAAKINLGIPNYGYDWPLPFVQGITAAATIGNVEAIQIAIRNGAPIFFDETAQSPFFQYDSEGIPHEVWFEDVRSIQAKFNLIKEFQLRGAGYWQLMRWWRANWLLMEDTFSIL